MKILVTGGAGFIGSALIRQALSQGHAIVNVDKLTYAANLQNLPGTEKNGSYRFEKIDICDSASIRDCLTRHQPDAVMHLAAESHVDRSIDGPSAFVQTNIVGTFTLLEECLSYWETLAGAAKTAFRFHHVSTDEVYGDLSQTAPAFTESHAYGPSSPYSASKAASDHLVRAWARTYGLPVLISNCSNNYGPYQFPEKLIPVVILKVLGGNAIPVYGNGDNIRDWLYVGDHADALLTVLKKGEIGETYNIGGNNERSNLDLVKTICKLMDDRGAGAVKKSCDLITFVKDRPGHDKRYAVNADKIKNELGWTPSVKFDDGFAKTIDWYLENRDWWQSRAAQNDFGKRLGKI